MVSFEIELVNATKGDLQMKKKFEFVSETPVALEILMDEMQRERQNVFEFNEATENSQPVVQEIIDEFIDKVASIAEDWMAFMDIVRTDGIKTINDGYELESRPHKGGYIRDDSNGKSSRVRFRVKFDDGAIIDNCKFMHEVYVRAIEKMGEEKVARLGWTYASEPIVTNDESELSKYPQWTKKTRNGWYVATHINSHDKMRIIECFSKALGNKAVCEVYEGVDNRA